jgi:predicted DCC family thiol-disulfide oxidoreductase YuxK
LTVILYDGVCHLCHRGVNFVLRHDKKKIFQFSPLQSEYSKKILRHNNESDTVMDTFILITEEKIFHRSDAALKILMMLGGGWKLFYPLYIFPKFFRNGIYNFVSRNRYKWFGKEDQCIIPSPEIRERFIL